MSPRSAAVRSGMAFFLLVLLAGPALARVREPTAVYAERRARLRAQVHGPIVLFGYTGKEDASPSYVFNQEENFYYLTGHNESGAALVLVPDSSEAKAWKGSHEILLLPPHDPYHERWEGPRMGPNDPGVQENTGFQSVESFANLGGELDKLAKLFPHFYTLLPRDEDIGYPHARAR